MEESVRKKIREYFKEQNEVHKFTGSVLVQKDNDLYAGGFGFADLERKITNNCHTGYIIGSLTKSFVAAGIMMLDEMGKLSICDSVSKYIPEYKHGSQIRIFHLLNHTSGIWCYLRDMDESYWPEVENEHTVEQVYKWFADKDLIFPPGYQYSYSNSGYVLLGMILERVSRKSFGDFLRDYICKPLQMDHTYYDPSGKNHGNNMAKGYLYGFRSKEKIAPNLHVSFTYTTGGIKSTVVDLYKWIQALWGCRLFSRNRRDSMFCPGRGDYGFAWWRQHLKTKTGEKDVIWHWGCTSGYHGIVSFFPDESLTIVMYQNMTSPNLTSPEKPEALLNHRQNVLDILGI